METRAMSGEDVRAYVDGIIGESEDARRVYSIGNGVLGVIHGAALAVHSIGSALAQADGLNPKHAVKQVDRLLSNPGFDLTKRFREWVSHVIGTQKEIVVALDWTDYDSDGQATISLALATRKGRAQPLMWRTVRKSELEGNRNWYEDELLVRFAECVPDGVQVTLTADRGFCDQKLFAFLKTLGFDYVMRFKGSTYVYTPELEGRVASRWLKPNGHAHRMTDVLVTQDFEPVHVFVSVKKQGMKEAWYLVSSRKDWTASQIIDTYSKRFTIEEMFRDEKDPRFGLGLSQTRISKPQRRDKLLFLAAMARDLLTVLGAAGESLGMDRLLKVNTVKTRTHSLYRQGSYYYGALLKMKELPFRNLMLRFGEMILSPQLYYHTLGLQ
jgi:hypothetical protein